MSAMRCAAWADAIGAFWRALHERGAVDDREPLDVVDLSPGQGDGLRPMLRALIVRLADAVGPRAQLRYLSRHPAHDEPGWGLQPELRCWRDAGVLVPLRWRPGIDEPRIGGAPWRTANPAVFLSHGWLQCLTRRLLAVHYGQLFEADLNLLERLQAVARHDDLWRPLKPEDDSAALARIRRLYAGEISSSPVCVGETSDALIQQFAAAAPSGYLALHAAPGTSSRVALRLSSLPAILEAYRREHALPVNFELLDQHYAARGVPTWSHDLVGGWVAHAAVGRVDDAVALLAPVARSMAADLGDAPPLAEAMRAAVRDGDADVVLALLRSARHDRDVFAAACPALHSRVLLRPVRDARAWSDALRAVSAQALPRLETLPLHRDIALCAARIADWSLALQTWQRILEVGGPTARDLAHFAWCRLRTGDAVRASALVGQALALESESPLARQVRQHIERRLARYDDAWRGVIRSPDGDLVLEPLDALHVDALMHQYRDPQIAVMAGLPSLPAAGIAPKQWFATEYVSATRMDYAVLHPDRGFVGQVGLEIDGDLATFSFWIGVDFQGRGYAIEAGRTLCRFAGSRGVDVVFATAFLDNLRSLRALQAIGFRRLPLHPTRSESARAFLAWAPPGRDGTSLAHTYMALQRRKMKNVDFEIEIEDPVELPQEVVP